MCFRNFLGKVSVIIMKIKVDAELAYLAGLWKTRRSEKGLGICGGSEILEIFIKLVLSKQMTTPEKILSEQDCVFFHHTAYKNFLEKFGADALETLTKRNEKAAAYLAGMFDGCGGVKGNAIFLARASLQDEILLERLGFRTLRRGRVLYIKPAGFIEFIASFIKHPKLREDLKALI